MPFIPHSPADTSAMLQEIGVKHIDDLFAQIPEAMRPKSFNIPEGLSEADACTALEAIAAKNVQPKASFLGGGAYNHAIPAAVGALSGRGEFYTAYTPYQPEASQGTLQAIFEYQTAICRLLDMEVGNASIYDGGSSLFEACMMAARATKRNTIIVDEAVSPFYRTMIDTLTANTCVDIKLVPIANGGSDLDALVAALDGSIAAVVLQNPCFLGGIVDYSAVVEKVHAAGALVIMAVNPVMASVMKTPGEMGVDIAIAEGQSVGQPLGSGGPYLGIMTCTKALVRQIPGRIVGKTKDVDGKTGYVLTLQAREQHIRRAKATSNICSNQALCALRTLIHLSLLGPEGLERTAALSMEKARDAADALTSISGVSLLNNQPFGYEFAVKLPKPAAEVVKQLAQQGIIAGVPAGRWYKGLENVLLVACTEKTTPAEIEALAEAMRGVL